MQVQTLVRELCHLARTAHLDVAGHVLLDRRNALQAAHERFAWFRWQIPRDDSRFSAGLHGRLSGLLVFVFIEVNVVHHAGRRAVGRVAAMALWTVGTALVLRQIQMVPEFGASRVGFVHVVLVVQG